MGAGVSDRALSPVEWEPLSSRAAAVSYVRSITKETLALTRKSFTPSSSTVAWNSLT